MDGPSGPSAGEAVGIGGNTDRLVRPLLDDQAPLLLRANCVRSLALLCASNPDARRQLQRSHPAATLTGVVYKVLDETEAVVAPFSKDSSSFGSRVSTVTRLHGYNLLALLLHGTSGDSISASSAAAVTSAPSVKEPSVKELSRGKSGSDRKSSRKRRARLDQSHIPEWRRVVVSPPSGRGSYWGQHSPISPETSPHKASNSLASNFAIDFFDDMMEKDEQTSKSISSIASGNLSSSENTSSATSPIMSSANAMQEVINAFSDHDHHNRVNLMEMASSAGLIRQLCGPTHGVSKRRMRQTLFNRQELPTKFVEAWTTPKKNRSSPKHIDQDFFRALEFPTLGHRYPKVSGKKPGHAYTVDLPPPPPSPRANSMRPVTPRLDDAPLQGLSDRQLHRDQILLLRNQYRNRDEDGAEQWSLEEELRLQQKQKTIPPLKRGLDDNDLIDLLTLVAPPDVRRLSPSSDLRQAYDAGYEKARNKSRPNFTLNSTGGSMVLLPIQPSPRPPSPPPPPPPAPSSSSSVFLWLPQELQGSTQNLIVRTELAREATRRAQIGLAQYMAREMLKLPFDFMADHGTPEMLERVGALAFRVAMQRLSCQRKGST